MRGSWVPLSSTPGFCGTWSARGDTPGPGRARAGDYYVIVGDRGCNWHRYCGERQVATDYRANEWTPFELRNWLGNYESPRDLLRQQILSPYSIAGVNDGMFVAHRLIRDDGSQMPYICPSCLREIAVRRGGLNPYIGEWTCDDCRLEGPADGQQLLDAVRDGLSSLDDDLTHELDMDGDLQVVSIDEMAHIMDAPPATLGVLRWLQANENATLRAIAASQYEPVEAVIEAVYWLIRNGHVDFTVPPDTRFSARFDGGIRVEPLPEPPAQPSGKRKKIVV